MKAWRDCAERAARYLAQGDEAWAHGGYASARALWRDAGRSYGLGMRMYDHAERRQVTRRAVGPVPVARRAAFGPGATTPQLGVVRSLATRLNAMRSDGDTHQPYEVVALREHAIGFIAGIRSCGHELAAVRLEQLWTRLLHSERK